MGGETRLPHETVLPVAKRLYRALEPVCEKIVIAGSLRRQKPDVGDIEIVAAPKFFLWPDMFGELVPEETPSLLEIELKRLITDGVLKWDANMKRNGQSYKRFIVPELGGMPFELFLCDEHEFGYQTMIRTGDAAFTKAMMTERRWNGGLKPQYIEIDGGPKVKQGQRWVRMDCYTERELFEQWGLPVLPPCERDEQGVAKLRATFRPT